MNLDKKIFVVVDRPLGSRHPKYSELIYTLNYGYVPNIFAPDGEEQDVYILGEDRPLKYFQGKLIAIIHRKNDVEQKWVVCKENLNFTEKEIREKVDFIEKYFDIWVQMI